MFLNVPRRLGRLYTDKKEENAGEKEKGSVWGEREGERAH